MIGSQRFVRLVLVHALATVLAPLAAWSQPAALGPEFQINTYTTASQLEPALASSDTGDAVVVWGSLTQDGDHFGVFAQRYDGTGNAAGSEFQINTYTTHAQYGPAVASDSSGRFVVVWASFGQDGDRAAVIGRRYDSAGNAASGEFQINSYTTAAQMEPAIASDSAGNFIVVWTSSGPNGQDGDGSGIFGQRYDSVGNTVGTEFQVNTYTTKFQSRPAVALDPNGNFVVAWDSNAEVDAPEDGQDGDGAGVFAQRYLADGSATGPEFQVNAYTTGTQINPAVSVDATGGFIVVWTSIGQPGESRAVAQRYDADGSALGSEFTLSHFTNPFPSVSIAHDSGGIHAAVWGSDGEDGDEFGVFGQRFDAAGNLIGAEFPINTYTTGDQFRPVVAATGNGHFMVAWQDVQPVLGGGNDGVIVGRRFDMSSPVPWCDSTPALDCKTARTSRLKIRYSTSGTKDRFSWKFGKGDATSIDEFLDPIGGAPAIRVCIYGRPVTLPVREMEIPFAGACASNQCWEPIGTKGYKFEDESTLPDGILKASLQAGEEGKSQIAVKGRGSNLDAPELPLVFPVTVQMVIENEAMSTCWQSVFDTEGRNDSETLSAKAN